MSPCTHHDMSKDDDGLEEEEDLALEDYINIHAINRRNIRDQGKILAPLCGLVLTGALGLLYYIHNSNVNKSLIAQPIDADVNLLVIYLLLAASIFLGGAIVSCIRSVAVKSQKPIMTKYHQIDDLMNIYAIEYKWARYSVVLLIIAILLFIGAMIIFSNDYLSRDMLFKK